jgi:hypothetical protein
MAHIPDSLREIPSILGLGLTGYVICLFLVAEIVCAC